MNITKYSKTLGALFAAVFAAALASEAQAGPGPQQIYRPVTTMKQAMSIPVGQTIAISCGNCSGITTLTVNKDRSYLKGYTCPSCKHTFRVISPGGGSKGTDIYTLEDKHGRIAHLSTGGKL